MARATPEPDAFTARLLSPGSALATELPVAFADLVVPTSGRADPGSKLPPQALWSSLDALPDGIDARGDQGLLIARQLRDRFHVAANAVEVQRHRVVETPLGGEQAGDVRKIEAPRLLRLGHVVLQQQHHQILEVLLVDLDDLQLLEQEVGQRDRHRMQVEPALQLDRVAEVEPVEEHVDAPATSGWIVEDPTTHPHIHGDAPTSQHLVAELLEHGLDLRDLLVVAHEVQVGQHAVGPLEQPDATRALLDDRQGAKQSQVQPSLGRRGEHRLGLGDVLGPGRERLTDRLGRLVRAHPTVRAKFITPFFGSRSTNDPRRTPSWYSEPVLMHRVRPILIPAEHSWMWPCSDSSGCHFRMASSTAVEPTGIIFRPPPSTVGLKSSSSSGARSRFEPHGGAWTLKMHRLISGTVAASSSIF